MNVQPGNAQIQGQRAEQQDAFGFGRFDDPAFLAHGGYLAVLADGMGGLLDGGEAARRAVRAFLEGYAAKAPEEPIPAALERALADANRVVHALAVAGAGEGDCGTTLVAAVLHQGALHWVAAGDSRLYHYEAASGGLRQLSTDHDFGRLLDQEVVAGYLEPDEAASHPDRRALTSFLGLAEIPEVSRSAEPLPLEPGDRVLLCSDGVYQAVPTAELAEALALPAQAAAEGILARVADAHHLHQDNATLALLALDADAPTAPTPAPRRVGPLLWLLTVLLALFAAFYYGGLGEPWLTPFLSSPPPVPADASAPSNAVPVAHTEPTPWERSAPTSSAAPAAPTSPSPTPP